jgi:hypothetical protein
MSNSELLLPRVPRWVRILMWFGIVFGAVSIYAWAFGVQTMVALETRDWAWKDPVLKITPARLKDFSISTSAGRALSYFGYEFEVPWDDLDEQHTRPVGANWQAIAFHSGKSVLLMRSQPDEFLKGVMKSFAANQQSYRRFFAKFYGEAAVESDYTFIHLVVETTPDKITLFTPRKDAVGVMMLVLLKSMVARDGRSGIFSVQTRDFRGFQYGNPQSKPAVIRAELFTDGGALEFDFHQSAKENAAGISQAEINRVIQTVHPVRMQTPSAGR